MAARLSQRRSHSKVAQLPQKLREAIHAAIAAGKTYDAVAQMIGDWVARGAVAPAAAPSRAAVARYGKFYLHRMELLALVREQAKSIVSAAGTDGMALDEAATNLVMAEIMSIFMSRDPKRGISPADVARIAAGLGKLQSSSVQREKLKGEFEKRTQAAAQQAGKIMKKAGISQKAIAEVEQILMGGA